MGMFSIKNPAKQIAAYKATAHNIQTAQMIIAFLGFLFS